MPVQHRRALPAMTGSMECVGRSGTGPLRAAPLAALLHGKLYPQHRVCDCQGASAARLFSIGIPPGKDVDDTHHDDCIVSAERFLQSQEKLHLCRRK